ncbi:MAG: transposase [Phycisphaeraceae bacterium]|nr:transposase [Phycisphaeraceae bacterium]
MPRKPRIEYAGAIYHVMSRGNRGGAIFEDDTDREMFLETLGQACSKTGWIVHCYVLMGNHYHVLLETPEANLVSGMQWLQSTFTQRFNVRHQEHGHLLQGRYKALLIDPDSETYFTVVSSYIHLNPARARLFNLDEVRLVDYAWSSYPHYLRPSKRPEWLQVDKIFSCLRVMDDRKGRGWYRRYMQQRVAEIASSRRPHELDPDWSKIRRGWCLGEASFREKLLEHLDHVRLGKKATSLCGPEIHCHNERRAEQLKAKALKALNLTEDVLKALPKGCPAKQVLVWFIHSRTSVPNDWLCQQLCCGHPGNISKYVKAVSVAKDKQIVTLKRRILKSGD